MGKIPKQAVLYVFRPETNYLCGECVFLRSMRSHDACAFFGPDTKISAIAGGCGLFVHGEPDEDAPWFGLLTKEETGYAENKHGFGCRRCDEFIEESSDCKKVDKDSPGDTPGAIMARACCNRWEASPTRAKMSDEDFEELADKQTRTGQVEVRSKSKNY